MAHKDERDWHLPSQSPNRRQTRHPAEMGKCLVWGGQDLHLYRVASSWPKKDRMKPAISLVPIAGLRFSLQQHSRQDNKKGPKQLSLGPCDVLVAGTGFEPVTFGL